MLNKLREENLDKVDELLDRLPRNTTTDSQFDLLSELTKLKKNREKIREDEMRVIFYKDLISDKKKMDQLKQILGIKCDLKEIIIDYMSDDCIMPEIEQKISQVEQLLDLKHDISIYSEKNKFGDLQVLAELVSTNEKYANATILCTYGCDKELESTKKRVLTRCLMVLVCNIV